MLLRAAGLPEVRAGALCLCLRLRHIAALFGLAVPASAGAVIHLARSIDPNLTGASAGARSGARARRCRGRGRRGAGAGCSRGGTPRLDAAMTSAGAGPLCAGEGRAVLAGRCDCIRILRLARAYWQEEACNQDERKERFAHQNCSYERPRPSISSSGNALRNL